MSLPDQEDRALEAARDFLLSLSSGRHPARPITALRAEARRIVKHYPLLIDGLNTRQSELVRAVVDYHADTVSTHWDECYLTHAGCLAKRLQALEEEASDE